MDTPFPFDGPDTWRKPIVDALTRVVDPELALNIVDIGLVYGVTCHDDALRLRMTMTTAACPVTDVIAEEAEAELARALPPGTRVQVDVVWEPEWTPERMSERARRFMGW